MYQRFGIASLVVLTLISCSTSSARRDRKNDEQVDHAETKRSYSLSALSSLVQLQTALVQHEVDVNDDQKERVNAIRESVDAEIADIRDNYHKLSFEQRKTEPFRWQIRELCPDVQTQIEVILSPEQMKRLNQIGARSCRSSLFWGDEFLGGFVDRLGGTGEQREAIKQIVEQCRRETKVPIELTMDGATDVPSESNRGKVIDDFEEMRRVREEGAWDEIKNVLTPEQRHQLNEILGADFDEQELLRQVQEKAIVVWYQRYPAGSGSLVIQ